MAMTRVTLDVGDGRIRSLQSAVSRLNRELNRVYQNGQNNNYTVSNKNLTNLQQHLGRTQSAISDKRSEINQALDSAKIAGSLEAVDRLTKQLEELASANDQISQLFYGDNNLYTPVNKYQVSHSKAFESSQFDKSNRKLKADYDDLRHSIGRYSNRSKMVKGRWEDAQFNGVITGEQFDKYQGTVNHLSKHIGDYQSQLSNFEKSYNQQYQSLKAQRDALNKQITNGGSSADKISQRASLDEQLNKLAKYRKGLVELEQTLNDTNQQLKETDTQMSNTQIHITPRKNSLQGIWERHKRGLIRSGAIAGMASLNNSIRTGNQVILNTFDNVKSIEYATDQSDYKIENNLANTGFNLGMDLNQMSGYLNSYTASTGNASLSIEQQNQITGNWAGLSRYSGAKDATTRNLEYISGLTALSSNPKDFSRLANEIQNSITKSKMSAKADEQQRALAGMYQTAYTTGGPLTHQEQRNLAGFQAAMANTRDSSMQGQNGLQAYQGLVSAFSPNNITSRMLFGAGDASTGTPRGQAAMIEHMQRAAKNPYYYKEPIGNLLANASTQTKNKREQRRLAATNLMQLANDNGSHMTSDQAEHLVKMYQEGKFDKKHLNKLTSGKGKGYKKQYDKSGIKGLQQQNAAYISGAKKTAHALNFFTRKLNWVLRTSWLTAVGSQVVTSIGAGMFSDVVGAYVAEHGLKGSAKNLFGVLRSSRNKVFNKERATNNTSNKNRATNNTSNKNRATNNTSNKERATKNINTSSKLASTRSSASGHSGGLDGTSVNRHKSSKKTSSVVRGAIRKGIAKAGKLSRGKKAGLALGAGMLGYGLLNAGNNAESSSNKPHDKSKAKTSNKKYDKPKASAKDVKNLTSTVRRKYKLLHRNEWKLIYHLNTYWDVFLRQAKEAGSSDSDSSGSADSPNGEMSKEDFAKLAREAAEITHQHLSDADIDQLYSQAYFESGVNPAQGGGYDDHDGTGLPIGLFQFKVGTWNAAQNYMPSGHNNIHSALDQLVAVLSDKNWRSDLAPTGVERGWSPHYSATGGIVNHATGSVYQGSLVASVDNRIKDNSILGSTDIHSIYMMSRIKASRNYIKSVRNQPKFNIKIDVSQAKKVNRSKVINQVTIDTFNEWLSAKKQANLQAYYSNEMSGQLI